MKDCIILAEKLTKVFKVAKKKEGFFSSVKFLFNREYTYIKAIDNLNLEIRQQEIRGIIGPNGAGKSTLIKMISGILYPTDGSIKVMNYTPWREREKYVRHIGVLLGQKTQLFWDLPSIDTFLLNKEIYNIPEKIYKENIEYFRNLLGLDDIMHKPVRNLSLGERMKCEMVCAMLHNPELVYLDEQTIRLDVFAKEYIRNLIRKINKEKGVTFILTTHDLKEIENLCSNVTLLDKGKIIFDGKLSDLKTYFPQRKIIKVKFNKEVDRSGLVNFKTLDFDPFYARIEVEINDGKILDEKLFHLLSRLPVKDIIIEETSIEDLIKKMYLGNL